MSALRRLGFWTCLALCLVLLLIVTPLAYLIDALSTASARLDRYSRRRETA